LKYQGLFKKAEALYKADETKVSEHLAKKDKDVKYYTTMISQGTLSDKINALQLLVQKTPERSLHYLYKLSAEAKKKNRKQAEIAIKALKDLFINFLLKDGSKLSAFQHNPRIEGRDEPEIPNFDLIDAYFDHCIKELYRDFIMEALVPMSRDDLEYFRKLALEIMADLISAKPEIEEVILGLLINKLGDGSRKVQQHTIMVLCKLLKNHPVMAPVLTSETNALLSRPSLSTSQKYYSVLFLNKIAMLSGSHSEQTRIQLFRVYFMLFKQIM
jgi:ribosome biogenesis protein MAK21